MSVKLINNNAFYGYRVRRTVSGKQYQEYFPLGGKSKKQQVEVERQARARDKGLFDEQQIKKAKMKKSLAVRDDGSIKGISYLVKKEKSGTHTPIFQIGIKSEIENRIICSSYSIAAHGKDKAWVKAVDFFAKHKTIHKNSNTYKKLLGKMPDIAD